MSHHPHPPAHEQRDRGAALLLAIGFVLMIGTITAGLAMLITSSVNNRVSLEQLRDREYAADAAVEQAISTVRGLDRSVTPACGWSSSLNGVPIRVDCTGSLNIVTDAAGSMFAQRNVVFSACVDSGSACSVSNTIIRAGINFEQQFTNLVTTTYIQSWSVSG